MASISDMNSVPRERRVIMDSHGCWHNGNGYATYEIGGRVVEKRCTCRFVGEAQGEPLARYEYYALKTDTVVPTTTSNIRPQITSHMQGEIKKAAQVAHYLASLPRPFTVEAPAEDEAADQEYAQETAALEAQAAAFGPVLKRSDLLPHEQSLFAQEFAAIP